MDLTPYLDRTELVYVMKGWGRPEHYKIGCTQHLRGRFGSKRARENIVLVILVSGPIRLIEAERQIHRVFSEKNVNGFETFALDDSDLRLLSRMAFVEGRLRVVDKESDGNQALQAV